MMLHMSTDRKRVMLCSDPMMLGTVEELTGRFALVKWDGDAQPSWSSRSTLVGIDADRRPNPDIIYAPDIQDLQFATRLDGRTESVLMERDGDFRGEDSVPHLDSSRQIYDWFSHMGELTDEHIVVGVCDDANRLLGWSIPHMGQLTGVEASTRRMLRDVMFLNGRSFFVLHNHPSGDPRPSDADKSLTNVVAEVGRHLGLELLDHVVVGRPFVDRDPYYSFHENGKIAKGRGDWIFKNEPADMIAQREICTIPVNDTVLSDLQFATKVDPDTNSIIMERDDNFVADETPRPPVDNPTEIFQWFEALADSDCETVVVVVMNVRREVIGWTVIEHDPRFGRIDNYPVSLMKHLIRPMIRDVMFANGNGFAVVTNHVGEDPLPSKNERIFTRFLSEVAQDMGIEFFDHMIIGGSEDAEPFYSFCMNGEIDTEEDELTADHEPRRR